MSVYTRVLASSGTQRFRIYFHDKKLQQRAIHVGHIFGVLHSNAMITGRQILALTWLIWLRVAGASFPPLLSTWRDKSVQFLDELHAASGLHIHSLCSYIKKDWYAYILRLLWYRLASFSKYICIHALFYFISICVYVFVDLCIYIYIYIYLHIHIFCTCTHIFTHTHIYIYIFIYMYRYRYIWYIAM